MKTVASDQLPVPSEEAGPNVGLTLRFVRAWSPVANAYGCVTYAIRPNGRISLFGANSVGLGMTILNRVLVEPCDEYCDGEHEEQQSRCC